MAHPAPVRGPVDTLPVQPKSVPSKSNEGVTDAALAQLLSSLNKILYPTECAAFAVGAVHWSPSPLQSPPRADLATVCADQAVCVTADALDTCLDHGVAHLVGVEIGPVLADLGCGISQPFPVKGDATVTDAASAITQGVREIPGRVLTNPRPCPDRVLTDP